MLQKKDGAIDQFLIKKLDCLYYKNYIALLWNDD